MHLGIPAVARPTLTVRRCLRADQVTMVDSDDPEVWGEAILALRRDPERRHRQAEMARAFARENCWDTHQQIYLDLVNALLRETKVESRGSMIDK